MKQSELHRCQITNWYTKFKNHTIKSIFHPLPTQFIKYLLGQPNNDGDDSDSAAAPPLFLLPRSATGRDPLPRTNAQIDPTSLLDFSYSDDEEERDDDDGDAPSFPDLESAVERSIAELGGAAFPKLNWSAPKDAAWIAADGTLKCSSFSDVALLLRSSDSIAHDLSEALQSCSDYADDTVNTNSNPNHSEFTFYLVLRKWYPGLRPEMEFRCFCRQRRLVAISQREVTSFYPVLLDRRHEIQPLVEAFFSRVVGPEFELEDYTFDVYVTGDGRVKVLDFNPWGGFTLPLMFNWDELEQESFGKEGKGVEFRIVESQCGVRPGLKTAVPYDYLDTGEGSGWDQFLRRADEELRKQAQS